MTAAGTGGILRRRTGQPFPADKADSSGRSGRLLGRLAPPPVRWLRGYHRGTLTDDLRAALTMGVVVIPQAMAYAALAGLPAITGLYATIVALVVYAALGTSPHTSPGPAAIDALLVAAAVGPLADGDPARYLALAGTLAVLTGLLQLAASALRLAGGIVGYVSTPVIQGFTAAAALTIVVTQLPTLLGVPPVGGTGTLTAGLERLAGEISGVDALTAVVSLGCLAALILLRRFGPRALPGPLLVLVAAGVLAALLGDRLRTLGPVPHGLPSPALPTLDLGDVRALLPAAAALALIGFLETIGPATVLARRARTEINTDQELRALGACNLAAGLFRGVNVAGGFSRGALQYAAGARTPLTCLLTAGVVAVVLLTLTPLLAGLPVVALAAVIVVAVAPLVDLLAAREVARVRRSDLAALVASFVATAVFGPVTGLAVGVGLSLLLFLRQSARPPFPELGRVPGTVRYRNVQRYPHLRTDPGVVLLRLDAPLYFANAQAVAARIGRAVSRRADVRAVVLDGSAISWIDFTGAETLARLDEALAGNGVALYLAALRGQVRDVLRRTRFGRHLDDDHRLHPDVHAAVLALDLDPASPLSWPEPGAPTGSDPPDRPTGG